MATATLSEKVPEVADTVREKVEDFDPEELLSVAEETAHKLRRRMPVDRLRDKAVDRVKGQPFKAMSLAFAAGALLGVVIGRLAAPCPRTGDSLVS